LDTGDVVIHVDKGDIAYHPLYDVVTAVNDGSYKIPPSLQTGLLETQLDQDTENAFWQHMYKTQVSSSPDPVEEPELSDDIQSISSESMDDDSSMSE
jgi:hypothetical protein